MFNTDDIKFEFIIKYCFAKSNYDTDQLLSPYPLLPEAHHPFFIMLKWICSVGQDVDEHGRLSVLHLYHFVERSSRLLYGFAVVFYIFLGQS